LKSAIAGRDPVSIAERLAGESVVDVQACAGGANNRVYRVRTRTGKFALKFYPTGSDERDRMNCEYAWLRFLGTHGVTQVPRALACDADARAALYEWIEGGRVDTHGVDDVDRALGFLRSLHQLRDAPGAEGLSPAAEGFETVAKLNAHLAGRIERLRAVADEPALGTFLSAVLEPEFLRRSRASERPRDDPAARTLSPSDFSFHNALRRPGGEIAFLDFEYAGWDDPVKLTSDFLWHPGAVLDALERERFRAGAEALYGDDPDFAARLAAVFPLFGLKWALIVLNDFLPEFRERRIASGDERSWADAKTEQLGKASTLLASIRRL